MSEQHEPNRSAVPRRVSPVAARSAAFLAAGLVLVLLAPANAASPRPVTPVHTLATGSVPGGAYRLVAYRARVEGPGGSGRRELCVDLHAPQGVSGGCGVSLRRGELIAPAESTDCTRRSTVYHGLLSARVRRVQLRLRGGGVLRARVFAFPRSLRRGAAAYVTTARTTGGAQTIDGFDARGRRIARVRTRLAGGKCDPPGTEDVLRDAPLLASGSAPLGGTYEFRAGRIPTNGGFDDCVGLRRSRPGSSELRAAATACGIGLGGEAFSLGGSYECRKGRGQTFLYGSAAENVARVAVRLDDGAVVEPTLHPAPESLAFSGSLLFAVVEGVRVPRQITVFDGEGRPIDFVRTNFSRRGCSRGNASSGGFFTVGSRPA